MPCATPPGVLVAACGGHRCAGLHRLRDGAARAVLTEAVRASGHGVLVRTPCVGACARAAVVGVGLRQADGGAVVTHWFGGVDDPCSAAALVPWLLAADAGGVLSSPPQDVRALALPPPRW